MYGVQRWIIDQCKSISGHVYSLLKHSFCICKDIEQGFSVISCRTANLQISCHLGFNDCMHKIKSQIACSVSKLSIILDDFPLNQEHKSPGDIQFPKCWILGIFGFIVVYNGYLSVSVCSIKHINVWGTPETGIISSTCLLTELSSWFCCLSLKSF